MLDELIKSTIAIFVVMDTLGNIPIFSTLNKEFSQKQKNKNIGMAVLTASIILLLFLFLGNSLLSYFGIRLSSFKIAGGILLLILGLQISLGLKFWSHKEERHELALVPMGTPLITGPGVITTVLILVGQYGYWIPLLASVINLVITFFLLKYLEGFLRIFGKQGAIVISRIMGLIIIAIAVEFILQGLNFGFIPSVV